MQRVRRHEPEPPDSAALQAFVIHDYLIAARLRRDLAAQPGEDLDAAIDDFVHAHAGQPVARALRHDWLASLADRLRWDWFLPRAADATDPVLVCDRLEGRLATGDTAGLAAEALVRWSLPQQQPSQCNGVFAWLRLQGLLTVALADSRTRAALAADNPRLARLFVADVPAPYAAPLLQWLTLLESPQPALAALAAGPAVAVESEALAAGFNRLARTNSIAAAALLPRLLVRAQMTDELRARLQRMAALGAAYDHDPGAVGAFEALPESALDDASQEWRARAALWAGDFDRAKTWIEQMPASLAAQPRWRYWYARTVAATGGTEAAAALFGEIAGLRDYYGYLAADRLHRDYSLNARPSPLDEGAQSTLAALPGLLRAHALFDCGMEDEAAAEWGTTLSAAKASLRVQAAQLAARWGWYSQSIASLAQAGEWDDVRLRYPRPFAAAVAEASRQMSVPADWILAVMRQESLFRPDAVSRADARGLMQMQPATAFAVARRWHLAPPLQDSLFDPGVAVMLGAAHLHDLLDRYGGNLGLGLAAYNAGLEPVARWMPRRAMDLDVWIENIPYGETRGYVQHILEHIVAFAWVRDAPPPRLADLLPPLAGPP